MSKLGNGRVCGVFISVVSGQRVPFRTLMNGSSYYHGHRCVLWKVSTGERDGRDTVIEMKRNRTVNRSFPEYFCIIYLLFYDDLFSLLFYIICDYNYVEINTNKYAYIYIHYYVFSANVCQRKLSMFAIILHVTLCVYVICKILCIEIYLQSL